MPLSLPLFLLITLPLYFGALYGLVIPALRALSLRVQGARFTYRLRPNEPTETPLAWAGYDIAWSFGANVIALFLAVLPVGILVESGLGAHWFGP